MWQAKERAVLNSKKNICLMGNIIDWDLLEQHLGHHFEKESSPPLRLLLGLLYLMAMNNSSYEETLEHWCQSPEAQYLCGGYAENINLPIRPSTLSIWNREIGDQGIYWMRAAITVPLQSHLIH